MIAAAKPMPPFVPKFRNAVRQDRKTMTRRVMKPQPDLIAGKNIWRDFHVEQSLEYIASLCPYGQTGDVRYLREPLTKHRLSDCLWHVHYADDDESTPIIWKWKVKTLSGLYMPKEFARTFVKIVSVRVERLHDIGKDGRKAKDVLAEGINKEAIAHWQQWLHPDDAPAHTFGVLWDSLNAKRGFFRRGVSIAVAIWFRPHNGRN
jgi:hypothetical protein